jgi:hypothetical protein
MGNYQRQVHTAIELFISAAAVRGGRCGIVIDPGRKVDKQPRMLHNVSHEDDIHSRAP